MNADDRLDDRVDWATLESSLDLDSSSKRALKDLERIAMFNREIQRTTIRVDLRGSGSGSGPAPGPWGHLMLLERIGAGAQGEVWRAWDATLQRQVALKFLQAGEGTAREPSGELIGEARALARIRHPGVVAVYGVAEHDGRAGMWMEWIEGTTLAREIERRGALPEEHVTRIGLELCSALEALESAGIVHRDVKPANIVLEAGGRVVLTDFGLGWRPALDDQKAHSSGTPFFMAPELLRGGRPSGRSDLYALGVTLWWALAGHPPFQSKSLFELREEATRGPSSSLRAARPGAPDALAHAIEWAMNPEESERPRSATQLRERLQLASAAGLPSTVATSKSPPVSRHFQKARGWWMVGAAALVLAGVAWWIATRSEPKVEQPPPRWIARQIEGPEDVCDCDNFALSPDGTRIAYETDSTISVFSIDTNDTRVVDHLGEGEGSFARVEWASDGSKLVVGHCDPTGEAAELLVDPITGHRDVLAHLGSMGTTQLHDMQATVSPDGRFVAVRGDYRASSGVFRTLGVVDVRSGVARTLVRAGVNEFIGPPAWHPSSTRLSYVLSRGERGSSWIETCDLRGAQTTVVEDPSGSLVPFGSGSRTLSWWSDTRLLYSKRRPPEAQSDLWMVSVDRAGRPSGPPTLAYTLPGAAPAIPSISRDGSVVFVANRFSRRLELIGTDGGVRYARLSQGTLFAGLHYPVWSQDGTSLFAMSVENPGRLALGRISLSAGRFEPVVAATVHDQPLCATPDSHDLLTVRGAQLLAVPLQGGAPRILAKSFVGVVLYAPRADRWVSVEHVGGNLLIRDFTPSTGLGAVRFRYPAPKLEEALPPSADLSPDGTRLAVLRRDEPGYDILDAKSGRVIRRVGMPAKSLLQSVRWSADGTALYATCMGVKAPYSIVRISAEGVDRVVWKSDDVWAGYLAISPDGSTLAFTTLSLPKPELWILRSP